jgi:hypothetical protein
MRYRRLIENGAHNGGLYYNLGNCELSMGQTGRAILSYKRAMLYTPHDPNLLHNLAAAKSRRADHIEQDEQTRILKNLLFWHYDISYETRGIIFTVFFLAFWGVLTLRLFVPKIRRMGLWPVIICGVVWVALLGSLLIQPLEIARDNEGVITSSEIIARKGDGESYQPAFTAPLHAGTEFTLLETRPGWYEVELTDGRRCWIPQDSAGLVRTDENAQ